MPINVRREFSSVGLAAGTGVFAPAPLPSGELEATRAVGGATLQRLQAVAAASDTQTQGRVARGQAVQQLGAHLRAAGPELVRLWRAVEARQDQAFARQQAATARTDFTRDAREIVEDSAAAAAPSGRGLAGTAADRLRRQRNKRLDQAGGNDPVMLAALDRQLGTIAEHAALNARRRQTRQEHDFLATELDRRVAVMAAEALQHPGAPEQAQLLQAAVDDIRDAVDEGLLGPARAERKIAGLRRAVLTGTVATLAAREPDRGRALLAGGGLDHLVADDAERRQAESALTHGENQRAARERHALDGQIEDDIAARRASGSGSPALQQRIAANGGPDLLAAYRRRVADAHSYHAAMQALRWAPPVQARAIVDALRPPPTATGDDARQQHYRQALQALADRNRALRDDPVAYAAQHPAARGRAQNIAQQKALGVDDYGFYAKAEAAERVAAYAAGNDGAKLELLRQWRDEAGAHRRPAVRDLTRAGLPASARLLLRHAHDAGLQPVLAQVLQAERRGRNALMGDLNRNDARALRQTLLDALDPFRESMATAGLDEALSFDQVLHSSELLALSSAVAGEAPAQAARAAAELLFNAHYTYQDGYRVPVAFDATAVGSHAARLLAAVSPEAGAAMPDEAGGAGNLRWVNTADDDGLTLADAGGRPATDGAGRPLGLRFADAEVEGFLLAAAMPSGDPVLAIRRRDPGDAMRRQQAALPAVFSFGRVTLQALRLLPRLLAPGRAALRERLKAQVGRQLMSEGGKKVEIGASDQGSDVTTGDVVQAFSELAISGELTPAPDLKAELLLGRIPDDVADRIREKSGFDARGYELVLPSDDLQHTYNSHGDGHETDDRQTPLTVADFARLPALMADFDSAELLPATTRRPARLRFSKRVNGTVVWVEVIRRKTGRLAFKSMWKKKAR